MVELDTLLGLFIGYELKYIGSISYSLIVRFFRRDYFCTDSCIYRRFINSFNSSVRMHYKIEFVYGQEKFKQCFIKIRRGMRILKILLYTSTDAHVYRAMENFHLKWFSPDNKILNIKYIKQLLKTEMHTSCMRYCSM